MNSTFQEAKEERFAYHSIHDFFDIYILEDALLFIQTICKAASTKKIWKKGYPYSVLHYLKHLKTLIDSAYYICHEHAQREEAIIPREPQTEKPGIELLQASINNRKGETFWNSFPRHITAEQFYNPYLAISSFCKYQSQRRWLLALDDIQEFALVAHPISEVHPPYNLLNIQRHLLRLIEACHLLELRTNVKMKE